MGFDTQRRDYDREGLTKASLADNPVRQFSHWYDQAVDTEVEPNAMVLSTSASQQPTSRMVLLKGLEDGAFVFFTNYDSNKAQDLLINSRVALLFWWPNRARQVRVIGAAERLDPSASTRYFLSRPRGAQIAAAVSPQSRSIADRDTLLKQYQKFDKDHPEITDCPSNWGGYRVVAQSYEFWQGGADRLHDRFTYERSDDQWVISRLAP